MMRVMMRSPMVAVLRPRAISVVAVPPLQQPRHQVVLDPVPPKHPIALFLLPFPSRVLLSINPQPKHRHLRKSLSALRRAHSSNTHKCLHPHSMALPQRVAMLPMVSIMDTMLEVPPMQACMADT